MESLVIFKDLTESMSDFLMWRILGMNQRESLVLSKCHFSTLAKKWRLEEVFKEAEIKCLNDRETLYNEALKRYLNVIGAEALASVAHHIRMLRDWDKLGKDDKQIQWDATKFAARLGIGDKPTYGEIKSYEQRLLERGDDAVQK